MERAKSYPIQIPCFTQDLRPETYYEGMSLSYLQHTLQPCRKNSWPLKGSTGGLPAATKNLPQFLCQKYMFHHQSWPRSAYCSKVYPSTLLLMHQIKPNIISLDTLWRSLAQFLLVLGSLQKQSKTKKITLQPLFLINSHLSRIQDTGGKRTQIILEFPFGSLIHLLPRAFPSLAWTKGLMGSLGFQLTLFPGPGSQQPLHQMHIFLP